jgi:hypothetical protein
MVPPSSKITQSLLVAFWGLTGIRWLGILVRKRLMAALLAK